MAIYILQCILMWPVAMVPWALAMVYNTTLLTLSSVLQGLRCYAPQIRLDSQLLCALQMFLLYCMRLIAAVDLGHIAIAATIAV